MENRKPYLEFAVDFAEDSDRFVGPLLLDDFGPAVGALLQAESDKDGICHLDENVVHAIDVDAIHPATPHVVQDLVLFQSWIQLLRGG